MFLKIVGNTFSLIALVLVSNITYGQKKPIESFPLSYVRLLDSPFLKAQQTDMKYILELDADRLLAPYLREAGIEPLKVRSLPFCSLKYVCCYRKSTN